MRGDSEEVESHEGHVPELVQMAWFNRSKNQVQVLKIRKKPVMIIGVLLTRSNVSEVVAWVKSEGGEAWRTNARGESIALMIQTTEGQIEACYGDYICKGVVEEFYPVKPNAFALTHEVIEDQPQT